MWRMHKLRPDFYPAQKVQVEDDITASIVVPRERVRALSPEYRNRSVKIVENCEEYLFQRPDDAVHRGLDAQAEADIATLGTFITNFEPNVTQASELVDQVAELDRFTAPMKDLLTAFVAAPQQRVRRFFPTLVWLTASHRRTHATCSSVPTESSTVRLTSPR